MKISVSAVVAVLAMTMSTIVGADDGRPAVVCPVDVVEPVAEIGAFQGNVAAHPAEVLAALRARTLAVVRDICQGARVIPSEMGTPALVMTIIQWKQMRTDDPIGALILPRNSVVIRLQLRDGAASPMRDVTFKNHARFTLNQTTDRLLNDAFDKTVRRLLSSNTRTK